MQKASAAISADMRERHGTQPDVTVMQMNLTEFRVTATMSPNGVSMLTVKELHGELVELATRHLGRPPNSVVMVIADTPVSIR